MWVLDWGRPSSSASSNVSLRGTLLDEGLLLISAPWTHWPPGCSPQCWWRDLGCQALGGLPARGESAACSGPETGRACHCSSISTVAAVWFVAQPAFLKGFEKTLRLTNPIWEIFSLSLASSNCC